MDRDLFMVEGVLYSGLMFRQLGCAEPGTWYRIDQREDQVLLLRSVPDSVGRTFDAIAGFGRRAAKK